ncbi:uncharacterized protein LOC120086795 [Benincasa hispida]|uniref:uncharacterized protein LOC120086795 n=1 Tax=Benincasa hispida TaxID=102211 RepID=UPI0018FF2EA8|nr:uncharacterized protein LOC120086795 [Benincasa hispida]
MASSSSPSSKSFCSFIPRTILLVSIVGFLLSSQLHALKPPFSPIDLLPLLPRQVSWPILNYLNNAADLLPTFVGAVTSPENSIQWQGACFYKNTAWLEFHNKSGSEFGGGTLHIKASDAHSWTCMDLYIFATPYRITWDYYFLSREHTLEIAEWEGKEEFEYVKRAGVSIFLLQAGVLKTLQALLDVLPLFATSDWGEQSNIKFLENHMGTTFEERHHPWTTTVDVDDIHSGDFLALSKIRGPWGAFETLQKWVTGSYAGHSAVCLRDSEGKLWVAESGRGNGVEDDIIDILPWDKWWDYTLNNDSSNPHVAFLPLHPDLRAKFNETAAWEYVRSMVGKPYGYHNLIFSWIDTTHGNYPPPLDAHLVASVMTIWTRVRPTLAANLWNEALNIRLGTKGLDLPEILVEVEKQGSSFGELLAIPEQDDWIYADGKSASCVAFILEMYKEAGLFGSLASSIQVTEFTIKDAYTLNFYENNSSRLPKWCNGGDNVKLPYCQILGKYRMDLQGYNSIDPYKHMNERCPSLPTEYFRPKNC